MTPTKTHHGHILYLVSPPSIRTVAGEQHVWACDDGVLLLTIEEERQHGVVAFRGIPTHPLE
jgi:hypothetical protein